MKNYVYEVEVEDFDDLEYCGCEHSTRIKRYGLYSSLDAGILAVEDKEGPIIKDLLRGEDWMLSHVSLYADQKEGGPAGASFTVHNHSFGTGAGGKLEFIIRVQRVEVKDV
tara:strand:+ start:808 stop:1140 length:333 start_codon:yes stop_codon:yes gene_type:complete